LVEERTDGKRFNGKNPSCSIEIAKKSKKYRE
ncbi:unnamed protein product, partial [marine sediment metagenome]